MYKENKINYYRKIIYLEYREHGNRKSGAGFVKIESWEESCNMEIKLSLPCDLRTQQVIVYAEGFGYETEICRINTEAGYGFICLRNINPANLMGTGMELLSIRRIWIPLGEDREVLGLLEEELRQNPVVVEAKTLEKEPISEETMVQEAETGEPIVQEQTIEPELPEIVSSEEEMMAQEIVQEIVQEMMTEFLENEKEEQLAPEHMPSETETRQLAPQPYTFQTGLQPGKWEQLKAIYPTIAPFGDSREYLQISPGDFVILKDKSYRLANNSFLLHGYFNYKHLILHRTSKKGNVIYYVGVPGNFYDKEKEVALLFGFESFECGQEPAGEGDYGYYMMRVEL